jgi:starvation-inducible DNA-binding protein
MTQSTNGIGLDAQHSAELVRELNLLLANYSVLYMNVRGFHWNIRGERFFELHLKFEELYNDLQLKIDEIAERILTLGGVPDHSYATYHTHASIAGVVNVNDGTQAVGEILKSLTDLIVKQRSLLKLASESDDEGTSALMSDYIRQQEKLSWMYGAYLG